MDFTFVPDILKDATPEAERPWSLSRMGELLKIAYKATEHPIFKYWNGLDRIPFFLIQMNNLEKFNRLNRTIVERTISQAEYFSNLKSEHGILTMRSKGIEYSIIDIESFLTTANSLLTMPEAELESKSWLQYFRISSAGSIEAALIYFLDVCNNIIELTYKQIITDQLKKIDKEHDKLKFLLRQKANLKQQENQFDAKVFKDVMDSVEIELGYHKSLQEFLEIPDELKAILEQFLAEKRARISNVKLLGLLMEEKLNEFCKELSDLVLQLFSYHDIGSQEPEKVYHSFLLGVFNSFKDLYRVQSNREAGKGRFDILLIPNTLEYRGIIFEVKRVSTDIVEATNVLLDEAIKQIEYNRYGEELKMLGHKEYFGIATVFYGKTLTSKYKKLVIS
jgi:hypothetical protein